jgi:hypothetical protein
MYSALGVHMADIEGNLATFKRFGIDILRRTSFGERSGVSSLFLRVESGRNGFQLEPGEGKRGLDVEDNDSRGLKPSSHLSIELKSSSLDTSVTMVVRRRLRDPGG